MVKIGIMFSSSRLEEKTISGMWWMADSMEAASHVRGRS